MPLNAVLVVNYLPAKAASEPSAVSFGSGPPLRRRKAILHQAAASAKELTSLTGWLMPVSFGMVAGLLKAIECNFQCRTT